MIPSVKTLEQAFPGKGKALRLILQTEIREELLELSWAYPRSADWYRLCFHKPYILDFQLTLAQEEIKGYDVEAIWDTKDGRHPAAEYINMGDTYAVTILFNHYASRFEVTSWGDWIERQQAKGREFK